MKGEWYVLFTDVERSTHWWQVHPDAFSRLMHLHDRMLHELISQHGGEVVKHTGDGVMAVFRDFPGPVAVEIQRKAFRHLRLPNGEPVWLRIAFHYGSADRKDLGFGQQQDYFGPAVNIAARLTQAGHGGQILLTGEALPREGLPDPLEVMRLGDHWLRDVLHPVRIFQLHHPDLPRKVFPPPRTLPAPGHHLPVFLSSFVGRDRELKQLQYLLTETPTRVITLVGIGGVGKTRLAVETALSVAGAFQDGIFFVPLESLPAGGDPWTRLSSTLGLNPQGDLQEAVRTFLQSRHSLIILDNAEHILPGVTDLVRDLLGHARQLRFLITSREPLLLQEEHVWRMEGLDTDSACRLFYDLLPSHTKPAETPRVHAFCEQLEGHPLALELAAGLAATMGIDHAIRRVQQDPGILRNRRRDAPERHSTLQAVFDSSWDLLSGEERETLKHIVLFRSPQPYEVLESMGVDDPYTLASLVDKSLVRQTMDGFQIPPVLRHLARKRVSLDSRIQQRYVEVILSRMERLGEQMLTRAYAEAYRAFSRLLPDMEEACAKAMEWGQWERLLKILPILDHAFKFSGEFWNATRFFQHLLNHTGSGTPALLDAHLRIAKAQYEILLGRESLAREHLTEAGARVQEIQDVQVRYILDLTWAMYWSLRDPRTARRYALRSLCLRRRYGRPAHVAAALNLLGSLEGYRGRPLRALRYFQEALSWMDRDPSEWHPLRDLIRSNMAHQFQRVGEYEQAEQILRDLLKRFRREGHRGQILANLNTLGTLYLSTGHLARAKAHFLEAAELARELHIPQREALAYVNLVEVEREQGNPEKARDYVRKARELLGHHGPHFLQLYLDLCELRLDVKARKERTEKRLHELIEQCRNARFLLGEAEGWYLLAQQAFDQGDVQTMRRRLKPLLQLTHRNHFRELFVDGLILWVHALQLQGYPGAAHGVVRRLHQQHRLSPRQKTLLRKATHPSLSGPAFPAEGP